MKYLSLFSGAGGGDLACQLLLGWQCQGYIEWEDYCAKVLCQRIQDGFLSDAPIFNFDIDEWIRLGFADRYRGMVDVVTGGFPCQAFSVAGHMLADEDARNKWPATLEVLRRVRPKYGFFENVPGLLSPRHGYFGTILRDLAAAGYDAEWTVLGASDVGAPHRRKRLWILAHRRDNSDMVDPFHDGLRGESGLGRPDETAQSGTQRTGTVVADPQLVRRLQECGGSGESGQASGQSTSCGQVADSQRDGCNLGGDSSVGHQGTACPGIGALCQSGDGPGREPDVGDSESQSIGTGPGTGEPGGEWGRRPGDASGQTAGVADPESRESGQSRTGDGGQSSGRRSQEAVANSDGIGREHDQQTPAGRGTGTIDQCGATSPSTGIKRLLRLGGVFPGPGACTWWKLDPANCTRDLGYLWGIGPDDVPDPAGIRLAGGGGRGSEEPDGPVESVLGRVANGVAHRVDRLKAIGNGQVPIVAATAWNILSRRINDQPKWE